MPKKLVKIVSNEVGTCPYCNGRNIKYDSSEFVDNMLYYPCTCNDCKRYFEEWYEMHFAGHNVGPCGEYEASGVLNELITYED